MVYKFVYKERIMKIVVTMNHPMTQEQKSVLEDIGAEFVIIPHPVILEIYDYNHVLIEVTKYVDQVREMGASVVFLQGEPSFQCAVAQMLARFSIPMIIATTPRIAVEEKQPDGTVKKTTVFKHCRFRLVNGVNNKYFT